MTQQKENRFSGCEKLISKFDFEQMSKMIQ